MKQTSLIETIAEQMLAAGMNPHQAAAAICRQMLVQALKQHHGNVCHTARALGMHRNTLSRKLVDLEIADVARDCRHDRENQQALKFGGRLPARTTPTNGSAEAGDRSRVA